MKVHIIAIGGRIMHTLALNLHFGGHVVSGSDDEIYDPSRSRLHEQGLLPAKQGWDASRISEEIDLIILGMHAKADNPELIRAEELGLEIISYPEYIYRESASKKRIVIAGSHGKTTTTAMILHVLQYRDFDFDYLIGAELEGFNSMVKLSDAPLIIVEGDEYLSSCLDKSPKMMHYKADISVITGIAWDHVNVFTTEESYLKLFDDYVSQFNNNELLLFYDHDKHLHILKDKFGDAKNIHFYKPLELLENGNVVFDKKQYRIKVFGEHNRANMMAALLVCLELGISAPDFFAAISAFKGASKRMELLVKNENFIAYRDFAHAPSKLKATVSAVKENFPNKKIIAIFELHTYSSLNKNFLPKYKGSLDLADESVVFYSKHTMRIKRMPDLDPEFIYNSFGNKKLDVIGEKKDFIARIEQMEFQNCVVLIMSSGTFDRTDIKAIIEAKL